MKMAGAVGIEPTPRALETLVLPLYYAPLSTRILECEKRKSICDPFLQIP